MKLNFRSTALASIAIGFAAWSTPAFADMTLVDAATLPCPIIYQAKTDSNPALQLAVYLEKISGKKFEVKPATGEAPARAILINVDSESPEMAKLGSDGFTLKTQGNHLIITGGGANGTYYGVFDFLSRELGCRWWSWNEEDVPEKAALKLGNINVVEKPAFAVHDIMSLEAQSRTNYFVYKSRMKSTLQFTGNHTLYRLLTEAAKANPEFWPMNDRGVRAPNYLHFNYLAPGIDQALADALSKVVDEKKGNLKDWIYFAGQGDWYGGLDQSPESKKIYDEEQAMSAPLIQMMNKTGAILQKKYPGIQVGTFAYMSTDAPPLNTKPADNVNIWLPRLRYGTTLSIEEAASDKNTNEKSRARSQAIEESIKQWAKIAPGRLYIWDYGNNYKNYSKPWPVLRAMAENIKFYAKVGVGGVMIQGNYGSTGGDLVVLKNWVWSKLLWNPKLDTETLIKAFCDGYYGPASKEMLEYVNALENSVREPNYMLLDEFNDDTAYLTPEVQAKMQDALKRAEAKTQGDANTTYNGRVGEAGASLIAMKLWTNGSLVEKNGQLWRADINKENGGEYTHPAAMELIKHLRGTSKTEWGTGVTQERKIVVENGGPLYAMTHGKTTAKIAPYQGYQRLYGVYYDGKQIIDSSYAHFGITYMEPVGTPTNDKVEMQGEDGYGNWDPKGYLMSHETVTQDEDGTLRWDFKESQLIKVNGPTESRVGTVYPATSPEEGLKYLVEIKTADGWKTIQSDLTFVDFPTMHDMAPAADFEVRVTTPDRKTVVTDTYHGPPAIRYGLGWTNIYGLAPKRGLNFYVDLAGVQTKWGETVPMFQRTIKIEAATPPAAPAP